MYQLYEKAILLFSLGFENDVVLVPLSRLDLCHQRRFFCATHVALNYATPPYNNPYVK